MEKWEGLKTPKNIENQEETKPQESSIIKVYKINGLKRLEDKIDFKSTSWKKSDDLWESPEGWIVANKEDNLKVAIYTKQRLQIKQEQEAQKEKEFHFPRQDESWKEVVEEQKKATEEELIEKEREKRKQRLRELELAQLERANQKKKWIVRVVLGLASLTTLSGAYIYYENPFKPKDVFAQSKQISTEETPNTNVKKEGKTQEITANQINKVNSHLLLYIVEETIWEAKVKATLYDKKTGQTKWEEITPYLNFDAKTHPITKRVKLLYLEIEKKPLEVDSDSLATSIKYLATLLNVKETQALDSIKTLIGKKSMSLGTYPSELVAKIALKEKWISPLGKLNRDITGKDHSKRYIISPTDKRSVGKPVEWQ